MREIIDDVHVGFVFYVGSGFYMYGYIIYIKWQK